MSRRYDSKTTIFSPEGRLYQVEYAMNAINEAGSCVGITMESGILIGAEVLFSNEMLDIQTYNEKIYKISPNLICSVAGITSDAGVLIDNFRRYSQNYEMEFNEPIPVEYLVRNACDHMHLYTQHGGYRPFGVSFLFAGWDEKYGFQLYQNDPSGNYSGMKATAIGRDSATFITTLKDDYDFSKINLVEAKKMLIKFLCRPEEMTKITKDKFEIAYITRENGKTKVLHLDKSEISDLIESHKEYLRQEKIEQERKMKERQKKNVTVDK